MKVKVSRFFKLDAMKKMAHNTKSIQPTNCCLLS